MPAGITSSGGASGPEGPSSLVSESGTVVLASVSGSVAVSVACLVSSSVAGVIVSPVSPYGAVYGSESFETLSFRIHVGGPAAVIVVSYVVGHVSACAPL